MIFLNEKDFRKNISVLVEAIRSNDMKPIIIYGENGIGRSRVLRNIGGVIEICKYGTPTNTDQAIKEIIIESLNRGYHRDDSEGRIQYVFSINDQNLFNKIKKTGIFKCFSMKRTKHQVLDAVTNEPL